MERNHVSGSSGVSDKTTGVAGGDLETEELERRVARVPEGLGTEFAAFFQSEKLFGVWMSCWSKLKEVNACSVLVSGFKGEGSAVELTRLEGIGCTFLPLLADPPTGKSFFC